MKIVKDINWDPNISDQFVKASMFSFRADKRKYFTYPTLEARI